MKKILFRIGYLGLGGIEQLSYDVIMNLKNKFEITLAIENHFNNSLVTTLPSEIKYFYLKEQKFEEKVHKIREKKKNIFYKLIYNYLLIKNKQLCYKAINKYIKENGEYDLFIDYDGMATKYIDKINIKTKIIWQHTSLYKNKQKMEKRLDKYDKIVLICDDMKKDYEKNFPKLKNKLYRIYNFLDFDRVKKLSSKYDELSEKEIEMIKDNYCVAVARLDYPKDFETLIEAFYLLKKRGLKEKLYIIGTGEQKLFLETKIKEKKLEDTVYLIGRKENPYVWIKNADLFVHSSKREGFALVLLEAMILNTMVISSNCPVGPSEILENGKNGKLFEVGNYIELSNLLEKYIKNSKARDKYIENSKNRVKDFEKMKVLQKYYDFLKDII